MDRRHCQKRGPIRSVFGCIVPGVQTPIAVKGRKPWSASSLVAVSILELHLSDLIHFLHAARCTEEFREFDFPYRYRYLSSKGVEGAGLSNHFYLFPNQLKGPQSSSQCVSGRPTGHLCNFLRVISRMDPMSMWHKRNEKLKYWDG